MKPQHCGFFFVVIIMARNSHNVERSFGYAIPRGRCPETGYKESPCDYCDEEDKEVCGDCKQ